MPGEALVSIREKQWTCRVASTPSELVTGLSGVPSIPPGTGMLFILPQEQIVTVTAVGMLFPLSVVFISEDLKVTGAVLRFSPGDVYTPDTPCRYFLEVNENEASGIEPGDEVSIQMTQAPGVSDWMTPVVTIAGVMMVGGLLKTMADSMFAKPKEKTVLYGPRGELLPQTSKGLYQRGRDGYPVGADKIMRDAWGPIPDPDQPFWSAKGFIKPARVYGWQWSDDYHQWRAFVRFPDGTETWTSPQHRAEGSLKDFMAKTEGKIEAFEDVLDDLAERYDVSTTKIARILLDHDIRSIHDMPDQKRLDAIIQEGLKEQHLPQPVSRKPTRDDAEIGTWAERDRIGIWLIDKRTDKTVAEWWDEDAREMFDQGFFKPGDIRHQTITGRAFEESVLDYAESVGIIAGGKYLAQTVRKGYYWTAVNRDTGEIAESLTPYTSSGRALRSGKAWVSRHWKGDKALVEVWDRPYRYSENLKIQMVASEMVTPGRSSAVVPTEPRRPRSRKEDELEFLPDSPEFLAYTIEDIGYRDKIDTAFLQAIARAKRNGGEG